MTWSHVVSGRTQNDTHSKLKVEIYNANGDVASGVRYTGMYIVITICVCMYTHR